MNLNEKLSKIQSELKAPKNQRNNFGNYNYRSCEDITEAVKPFLKELGVTLTLSDNIVMIGSRIYVQGEAKISDGKETIITTGYAREAETKKGMDDSQVTGAASSYARKYALNGLFAIDDTKDADATNTHDKVQTKVKESKPLENDGVITEAQAKRLFAMSGGTKNAKIVKEIIGEFGYTNTKDIKKSHYQEICDKLESKMKEI